MNVFLLLDRSGSMSTRWNEAINAINSYVSKLRFGDNIYIALFDGESYDVIRDGDVKGFVALNPLEYSPRGSTPLYDSCAKMISTAEQRNAEKTIIVIMTDGEENTSKEYSKEAIDAKMKTLDSRGWEVIFLGADFKNVEVVSSSLSRMSSKTMNLGAGNYIRGMDSLASSSMAYASGVAMNFSDDLKKDIGSTSKG